MTRAQILKRLTLTTISSHERETLQQLLHYMTVEGIDRTSSSKGNSTNRTRTNNTRTAQAYKQTKNRTRSKP